MKMLIMQPNFFIFIICNGKKAYYSFFVIHLFPLLCYSYTIALYV